MGFKKRMVALVLAIAMVVAAAAPVFAASSPENPGWKDNLDWNYQDHNTEGRKTHQIRLVVSKVGKTQAAVWMAETKNKIKDYVNLRWARNKDDEKVNITHIGDGTKGVFNSKLGKYITKVDITSEAPIVKIRTNAFLGSKVQRLRIAGNKIIIKKDAFKGISNKSPEIQICGTGRHAKDFTFYEGCFSGLSSSARIRVKKTSMSKTEYNKIRKRILNAGFKGIIEYR